MALSESMAAYEDCYEHFDRAKSSKKGIRVLFESAKFASLFRLRMNQARVLQRREAMRIYDRTDPKYGKSEYDGLRIAVRPSSESDGTVWVYVEPWDQEHLLVEELE